MRIVEGDLLKLAEEGHFDVIVHGCNCFCLMGAGIALVIKNKFPEGFEADLATENGSREKLGTISTAVISRDDVTFTIVNAYTQYHHSGSGLLADYDAIRSAFATIASQYPDSRIGYPLIGAGLAGGDWEIIKRIIDEELDGLDHTLVKFKP